jgi:hypothetical protein
MRPMHPRKYQHEIFDLKAAGIRSAFSVKVSDGKLKSKGMYVPVGTNPTALTPQEKANLIAEYSIYAPARGQWTEEVLAAFDTEELNLMNQPYQLIYPFDPKNIE